MCLDKRSNAASSSFSLRFMEESMATFHLFVPSLHFLNWSCNNIESLAWASGRGQQTARLRDLLIVESNLLLE